MKKFAIIAGAMAMAGALFLASPVSAQDAETITADPANVPAEAGDVTVTINGAGWTGAPAGLYVINCPGADFTQDPPVSASPGDANYALTACPQLLGSTGRATADSDGNWSYDLTITVDQAAIDSGKIYVIAGELAAGSDWSANVTITVGAEPVAAEEPEAEEAAEEPAEEAAEEPAEEAAEEPAEEPAEEAAEGAGGEEDPMTEESPMEEAEGTMAETGAESGLLAVIGVSVLLAGLFAVGIGRRFTKRS